MSVDSTEYYIRSSIPHFQDNRIEVKEVRAIEAEMNAHAVFWVRMLQAGKNNNNEGRYTNSMRSHYSKIAEAYTFKKDHKIYQNDIEGPPVRPLCDGSDCISRRFSFFISKILQEVDAKKDTASDSTEDMLAAISECNVELQNTSNNISIGSADVKALYPSLDIPFTIEVVCEQMFKSNISFEGVDSEELGLYLSLNRDNEYLRIRKVDRYCPYREMKTRGPKPKITSSGIQVKKEDRFRLWKSRRENPDKDAMRIMIKEAFKIALELLLQKHCYSFNGEIKKQEKGGPIGLDITGVVAKIFMCWWDEKLLEGIRKAKLNVFLYKRYVDDINACVEVVKPGMRWIGGKLIYNQQIVEDDRQIEDDIRTFNVIKQIGDGIHTSIKLEVDIPSNHDDRKIPILDLKVWIEEIQNENGSKIKKIMHEFYMKEMSSKFVIDADNAMPWKNKITILTQQCLRILLNCSPELDENIKNDHISYFTKRMQASGYNKEHRYNVVKSAFNAYEKIKRDAENGIRPMYRKKEWSYVERRREKVKRRQNWYGDYDAVMFIPATPRSELKRKYDEEIKRRKMKIRVVERSGIKMKDMLQKKNIGDKKQCSEDCFICTTSRKGDCMASGVTYKIECDSVHAEGKYEYNGKTMKNGYSRGMEHLMKLSKKADDSALWKHCVEKHESMLQTFSMSIRDRCRNDPTLLQIMEAIRIRNVKEEVSMNSRNEWEYVRVPNAEIRD